MPVESCRRERRRIEVASILTITIQGTPGDVLESLLEERSPVTVSSCENYRVQAYFKGEVIYIEFEIVPVLF